MVRMGRFDEQILSAIKSNPEIIKGLFNGVSSDANASEPRKVFESPSGELYESDCLDLLRQMSSDSVDLVFADPPFNLNKLYPSNIDDNLKKQQYLAWFFVHL